jgi:peptide/nickel transport system substrate-binding protein
MTDTRRYPSLPVSRRIPAPGRQLCGVAWDGKHLWHADAGTSLLYCLDADDGAILRTLECPDIRTCTSFANGLLWQVAGRPKEVRAIDPDTGTTISRLALVSETACGIEVVDDRFWTTLEEGVLMLRRLDDGEVERRFDAEPRIAGVTLARGSVWYTVDTPGLIVRVDPGTGGEIDRYEFTGTPTGLGWDGQLLWCADHEARELVALEVD